MKYENFINYYYACNSQACITCSNIANYGLSGVEIKRVYDMCTNTIGHSL